MVIRAALQRHDFVARRPGRSEECGRLHDAKHFMQTKSALAAEFGIHGPNHSMCGRGRQLLRQLARDSLTRTLFTFVERIYPTETGGLITRPRLQTRQEHRVDQLQRQVVVGA